MPTPEAESIFTTLMARMGGKDGGQFRFAHPSRDQIQSELGFRDWAARGLLGTPLAGAGINLDDDPYVTNPFVGGGQWDKWTEKQHKLWEANATAQIDVLRDHTDPSTGNPLTTSAIIQLFIDDLQVVPGTKAEDAEFIVDWGTVNDARVSTAFNLNVRDSSPSSNTVGTTGNARVDELVHEIFGDTENQDGTWAATRLRSVARAGNGWTWMVMPDPLSGQDPFFIGFGSEAEMEAGIEDPGIQATPTNLGGAPNVPYEIAGQWFTQDEEGNYSFDKELTDSVADGALRAHNLSQSGDLKIIGNSVYARNQAGEWVLDDQLSKAQALANVAKTSYSTQVYGGQAWKIGSDGSFTRQTGVDIQPGLIGTRTDRAGNLWGDYEYGPSKKIEGGEGFDFAKIDPKETARQLQANVKVNQDLEQAKFDLTEKNTELNYALETAEFNFDKLHKGAVLAEQGGQFDASLQMQGEAQRESSRATNLQTMLTQNSQQMQALDQIAGFLRSPSDALAASFALTGDADPSGFVSQADLINKQIADYNLGSTAIANTLNEREAQNRRIAEIGVVRENGGFDFGGDFGGEGGGGDTGPGSELPGNKDALTPGSTPPIVQETVPPESGTPASGQPDPQASQGTPGVSPPGNGAVDSNFVDEDLESFLQNETEIGPGEALRRLRDYQGRAPTMSQSMGGIQNNFDFFGTGVDPLAGRPTSGFFADTNVQQGLNPRYFIPARAAPLSEAEQRRLNPGPNANPMNTGNQSTRVTGPNPMNTGNQATRSGAPVDVGTEGTIFPSLGHPNRGFLETLYGPTDLANPNFTGPSPKSVRGQSPTGSGFLSGLGTGIQSLLGRGPGMEQVVEREYTGYGSPEWQRLNPGPNDNPMNTGGISGNRRSGGFAQRPVVVGEDGAELAIPLEDGGMMVLNQNQLGFNPEVLSRNRANAARRGGRYPVRNAQNGGIFPVSGPVTAADFAIPGFSEPTFSQRELQAESNRLTPPRARRVTQEFGSGYSPAPMVPFKQEVGGTAGFASPTPGYLAGLTTNEREFLRTNLASRNINLADVEQNAARLFGSTGARSGRRNF